MSRAYLIVTDRAGLNVTFRADLNVTHGRKKLGTVKLAPVQLAIDQVRRPLLLRRAFNSASAAVSESSAYSKTSLDGLMAESPLDGRQADLISGRPARSETIC